MFGFNWRLDEDANLLLFKTVIAGDSWGTIAVPVIEILGRETGWPCSVESI